MYNDIIYENEILSDFLVIKDVRENFSPEIINNSMSIKGKAGSLFINQEFAERRIEIDVEILANTKLERQQARDRLNYLLFAENKDGKLYIDDRYYVVVVESISSVSNLMNDMAFTIYFTANDPISYGNIVSVKVNNGAKLHNRGTYKVSPKIHLTASSSNAKVKLSSSYSGTYDYVEVGGLKRGDKVTFNFDEEKVYVNNKDYSRNLDPSGDFFFIRHGDFSLTSSGAEDVILEYRERWL